MHRHVAFSFLVLDFLAALTSCVQIGTGAAGFMAIRVLLDHGVKPSHIIFITFLVSRSGGVAHLRRTFPEVNIVTGAVDDGLREVWLENAQRHAAYPDEDGFDNAQQHKAWVVEPGMGQIGGLTSRCRAVSCPCSNVFFGR